MNIALVSYASEGNGKCKNTIKGLKLPLENKGYSMLFGQKTRAFAVFRLNYMVKPMLLGSQRSESR